MFKNNFFWKIIENLLKFWSNSFKLIDRNIKYCNKIKIKPIENSIAEKIKKKKVNDNKFKLSYKNPKYKTILYKEIHNNSAINNKFNDEFIVIKNKKNNRKNEKNNKFKSPKSTYKTFNKLNKLKFIRKKSYKTKLVLTDEKKCSTFCNAIITKCKFLFKK